MYIPTQKVNKQDHQQHMTKHKYKLNFKSIYKAGRFFDTKVLDEKMKGKQVIPFTSNTHVNGYGIECGGVDNRAKTTVSTCLAGKAFFYYSIHFLNSTSGFGVHYNKQGYKRCLNTLCIYLKGL